MTELEAPGVGEHPPPYIIFVVVFLFFLTGLLGFLICHLLKKKGYRCRTADMEDEDDEEEEKLQTNADDEDDENQDTVEQILKCIIENEANMEAFNEMLGNRNVCVRHDPRLRKESVGGVPSHHHTVHSGIDSCHLCAQGRSKKGRRQSRTPRFKQRPGEQTVFSVGRFRVTHNDKKLHGGPNQLVSSGDQLDQSQDSEERKEGGYNLRSMFKDVRPPSESSNGVAPNVGKRRKSLTIFGLRRGSDPSGTKAGEGTGKESGGVRFAIQQQPVVLEELLQAETEVAPERETKPGIKPETKPASPQREAKTSGSVCSPSSQSKNHDSRSAADGGPKHGPSPKSRTNLVIKPSVGSTAASVPSSLPTESPASSGQTFKATERGEDPGPLQTSTPIAPIHGPIPGLTAVIPTGQPETNPPTGFPVTQTPPDPSSSSDLEPGLGASLALISLGSSPPSSYSVKTPSSVSSLKTPTSPVTPSPKLNSRNTPSEAAKSGLSPALTPSPKLPSGRAMTSQPPFPSSSLGKSSSPLQGRTPSPALPISPKLDTTPASLQAPSSPADQDPSFGSSPRLTLKAGSVTPVTSSPVSLKKQEPEGARIPETGAKTEVRRAGILKKAKLSPVEGDSRSSKFSSPAEQLFQDRLSSLPLSPSSPAGGRISGVAVIKASPDSKREFSVVTMVEEEGSSPELGVESQAGVGQPEPQRGETSGAEFSPTVSQERDDMVEMEDIRDCKVMQVEEVEKEEEEKMVII